MTASLDAWYDLSVSLGLHVTGEEGAERWQTIVKWAPRGGHAACCDDGHHTPEAAASHGAELAAARMGQMARSLPLGTCGGDLIAQEEHGSYGVIA